MLFCFSSDPVTRLPKSKREKNVFLVDLNRYEKKAVLADDNGSYITHGRKTKFYSVNENSKKDILIKKLIDKSDKSIFSCPKQTWVCKPEPNLILKTVEVKGLNENSMPRLLIIYFVGPNFIPDFKLKPHGIATKVDRPYIRLCSTTLEEIKTKSIQVGSASMKLNELLKKSNVQGPLSDLPRAI